jgi:hypothetical protein
LYFTNHKEDGYRYLFYARAGASGIGFAQLFSTKTARMLVVWPAR